MTDCMSNYRFLMVGLYVRVQFASRSACERVEIVLLHLFVPPSIEERASAYKSLKITNIKTIIPKTQIENVMKTDACKIP